MTGRAWTAGTEGHVPGAAVVSLDFSTTTPGILTTSGQVSPGVEPIHGVPPALDMLTTTALVVWLTCGVLAYGLTPSLEKPNK